MSRYTGPRLRIIRALGVQLPGLTAKPLKEGARPPGQHGPTARRKQPSRYGQQLREKQKLRYHYGVTERQLRTIAAKAISARHNSHRTLVQLLELRLDNVLFRAGFSRTIPAARQLANHGHVTVNGRRLTIPSARLRAGDLVAVRSSGHTAVRAQQSAGDTLAKPDWLSVDTDALSAKVVATPEVATVPFPIELRLVIEFYS